jgi:hypothetical protein
MTVRQLTTEQKDLLLGQKWGNENQYFNPIQDNNGVWVISNEEVNGCTLSQAIAIGCDGWLLSLPEITYVPIPDVLP